jgi:hypothetical protein
MGGKVGRGSENNMPFIADVPTTEDGQPVLACLSVQPFTVEAASDFAAKSLALPLTVVSDGLWCCGATKEAGVYERIVTGGVKASANQPQFRAVNTVLSNMKTGLAGTYRAFNVSKYAHRYLGEFQCRFDRRFHLSSILQCLVRIACVTVPHPAELIRTAEPCRRSGRALTA